MIAGLLWYLRDGRKTLLCVSLFLAPLLQYGLVLFGIAVMGAAMILPPPSTLAAPAWNSSLSRILRWLTPRIALVWPAGCFLVGCALSYAVTVRYQWDQPDFALDGYLSAYYYQEKFDAQSIFEVFEFSIDGIWRLLTYHLPEVVAIAALAAFALLLAAAFLRKFQGSAIAVVFSLCIAISVAAAVLGIYPLGSFHSGIYLGPIVFLAVGVAFQRTAGCLASLTRRGWLAPALAVAVAGAIAFAGVSAMRQESPYQTPENIKSVLAILQEQVREEDMVYAGWGAVPAMQFYQGKEERPANYYYGTSGWCTASSKSCLREIADLAYRRRIGLGIGTSRIWFVTYKGLTALENDMPGISFELVVSGGIPRLYLVEDWNP